MLPEEALDDGGAFIEWYIHDYLLSSGKTILEEYYSSHFNGLTGNEREILRAHMKACPGIYEVQEVTKGAGMRLSDIFTGEALDVKEVRGSYQVVKWDFLMLRVYDLKGVKRFVGTGRILPRQSVQGLKDFLHEEKDFALDSLVPHKGAKLTWLKKGDSREWEKVKPEKGMIIESKFMHESGKLSWDILGGVSIDRKGLILECISKERLERGKQRLNNLLKDHIDHKIDTFENMEATIDRDRRERHDEEGELDSHAQFVMESMMQQKFRDWVNERIGGIHNTQVDPIYSGRWGVSLPTNRQQGVAFVTTDPWSMR
jgi:hypothetical protein